MIVLKVDPEKPDLQLVQQAADAIRAGELVIFPTETVYGLAADALNEAAVARVFEAKGRMETNPLPVQVSGVVMLSMVANCVPEVAIALAERFWPGPLTLVLEKSERISDLISAGTGKVGVRAPDHAVALALLRAVGCPIVASSANLSGEPPARNADDAIRQLGEFVSVILDAGESAIGVASTVVDVTVDPPVILRHGAISDIDIKQVLAWEITDAQS
jgi:L-threonylcarbamoyladenylate synthase